MKTILTITTAALLFLLPNCSFAPDTDRNPTAPGGSEWELLINEVIELHVTHRNDRAAVVAQKALEVAERDGGPNHLNVATSLEMLSGFSSFSESEPLLARALKIREDVLGTEHPVVISKMNEMADRYKKVGQFTEAEEIYTRVLAVYENAQEVESTKVAGSLSKLAGVLCDQSKFAQAEPLYERTLAIWERSLGPSHPLLVGSLDNLAALYRAMERNEEADALEQRAATIRGIQQ